MSDILNIIELNTVSKGYFQVMWFPSITKVCVGQWIIFMRGYRFSQNIEVASCRQSCPKQ